MKAINVLVTEISHKPNSIYKRVHLSQVNQLKVAVGEETIEMRPSDWEARFKPERHLAIAILNEYSPDWNRH